MSVRHFAENTTVSVEKSRAEIETVLTRYGASQFGYANDSVRAMASIQFVAQGRHVRFVLELPKQDERRFQRTPHRGHLRSQSDAFKAWEQACRQRWRALLLCIKAKLEAVECGITEFEKEFMAHIVLPGGLTVGELMQPQIERAYLTGGTPPGIAGMLPAPSESE